MDYEHVAGIFLNEKKKSIEKTSEDEYMEWIRRNKSNIMGRRELYYFFRMDLKGSGRDLTLMEDYYDVCADKIFSFSFFITNLQNLSYLIGMVYNYAILKKHFEGYKMRIYVDFHSVLGSVDSYCLFMSYLDVMMKLNPKYYNDVQIVIFYLNPFNDDNIYDNLITDLVDVMDIIQIYVMVNC